MKRLRRVVVTVLVGAVGLCLLAMALVLIQNANLPQQSQVVDRLSELEKARLAEAQQLRRELGDSVWPGWGGADIPLVVHNEAYAFQVGHPDPPDGWVKVPGDRAEGGPWEPVSGDDYYGEVYYRQRLADPEVNPENFTVKVGDRWAATMQTKEYSAVDFYRGFREELPPPVRGIFPYRLMWSLLGGSTDISVQGLLHECFHAYQGGMAPQRLEQAELANRWEEQYPWEDEAFDQAWQAELDLLSQVGKVGSREQASDLAQRFLAARQERRETHSLSRDLVQYERDREWLEGLAKYVEFAIAAEAAQTPGYRPVAGLGDDPDFKAYRDSQRYWQSQFKELPRMSAGRGEMRFYHTGMAQAVLLDWLDPDWKQNTLTEDAVLEHLLEAALQGAQ